MSFTSPQQAVETIQREYQTANVGAVGRLADEAVRQFPDSAELWAWEAHLLLWRGKLKAAWRAYRKARKLDSTLPITDAVAADLYAFSARYDRAKHYAAQALAAAPEHSFVLERSTDLHSIIGEHDEAIRTAQRRRELHPGEPSTLSSLYHILMHAGKPDEAAGVAAKLRQRFPGSLQALLMEGREYKHQHDLVKAEVPFRRATEAAPESAMAWAELAFCLAHLRRHEEASQAAQRALQINSRSTLAMQALKSTAVAQGDKAKVRMWQRRAETAIPALRDMALIGRGNILLRKGQWNRALRALKRPLRSLNPQTRRSAMGCQLHCLLNLKRWDAAENVAIDLQTQGGRRAVTFLALGQIAEARDDLGAAVTAYRNGLTAYPTDGEMRGRLLRVLHKQGRDAESRDLVTDLFANPPGNVPGCSAIIMALADIGRGEEARRYLATTQERFADAPQLKMLETAFHFADRKFDEAGKAAETLTGDWAPFGKQAKVASAKLAAMKEETDKRKDPPAGG